MLALLDIDTGMSQEQGRRRLSHVACRGPRGTFAEYHCLEHSLTGATASNGPFGLACTPLHLVIHDHQRREGPLQLLSPEAVTTFAQ